MKRAVSRGVYILTVILSISVFASAQYKQTNNPVVLAKYFDLLANQTFPSITFEDANGNLINTDSLKGKTIYVDCWFTLCPPCLKEIPYSKALQTFFEKDTNVVFLNICIENIERKDAWKTLVKEKSLKGVNVFYARNRPQKINLLRQLKIYDYPTYFIINKEGHISGYDAPGPHEMAFTSWAIHKAKENIPLSTAYLQIMQRSPLFVDFMNKNRQMLDSLQKQVSGQQGNQTQIEEGNRALR
jgi:thiol-disulfide isomerase/thioredoxin